jgi:uncharacterized membrane protein
VALAIFLPWLDYWGAQWIAAYLPWLITSRDISVLLLSHIASSMITVAGIVFSLTVLILSNASSSYGSRVLRNYMQDRVTQFAIGAFVAPSLYCFLVLRHLGNETDVVPHLSVSVGVAFAVFNFGVLIYFVHHVALAIQASEIIKSLSHELTRSIDSLFPDHLGAGDESSGNSYSIEDFNQKETTTIHATREGYLQVIDSDRLLELAIQYEVVVLVERRPGDFITLDQPVFRIAGLQEIELVLKRQFNETLFVGSRRTPRQDVECAVHELVEVAVRALSPGINDPFTAITCLDYLSSDLAKLARRKIPSPYREDQSGQLRVIAFPFTFNGVLDSCLNQIRQCSSGTASVLIRLLERLTMLADVATRKTDRTGICKHAEMVLREAERSLPEAEDLKIVRDRYQQFQKVFSGIHSVEDKITVDQD